MTNEESASHQELIRELVNLTGMMLDFMGSSGEDLEGLFPLLEQRQHVIDRMKQLPYGEIKEAIQECGMSEELLRLDFLLKQNIETRYQELRRTIAALRQRKASIDLYRKKGAFADGLFLDNRI